MTKHKLFGIVFPLFILFSLIFPLLKIETASAAPSPTEQATAWNATLTISSCSTEQGFRQELSVSDIEKGYIFKDGLFDPNHVVDSGWLIEKSEDGRVSCENLNSDIKNLFKNAKIDPVEFLLDTGIYVKEKNDFILKKGKNEVRSSISSYQKDKFEIGTGGIGAEAQYAALIAAFNKECSSSENESGDSVKIVDANGNTTTKKYIFEDGLVPVGFGLDGDGRNDQRMSCNTIAQQMNQKADKYSAIVKQSSDTGSNSENTEAQQATCESNNNDNLDWLLCGMIGGIDSVLTGGTKGSGGIAGAVDDLLDLQPEQYTDPKLKQAWSYMRNIASLALVVIALIMIIGQAVSKE